MAGLLLSFIIQLIGIAMVVCGIFLGPTGNIVVKLLSAWLLLSGIVTLIVGYLFIRVALGETDIRKKLIGKILPSFFTPSSFI